MTSYPRSSSDQDRRQLHDIWASAIERQKLSMDDGNESGCLGILKSLTRPKLTQSSGIKLHLMILRTVSMRKMKAKRMGISRVHKTHWITLPRSN